MYLYLYLYRYTYIYNSILANYYLSTSLECILNIVQLLSHSLVTAHILGYAYAYLSVFMYMNVSIIL